MTGGQPDQIDRRTSVLLIDATGLNADALGSDGPVVGAYENWLAQRAQDLDKSFAVDVPVVDLLAPDATLLPNRWTIDPTEHLSARDWTTLVVDSYSAASTAVSALGQALPSLKVTPLQDEARTLSIGELQKSEAIAVLRGRHMERNLAETAPPYPILTIRHVRPGADLVGIETEHVLASPSTTAQLVHKGDVIVYLDGSTVSTRVWPENGWVLGRFMQSNRVLDGSLDPEYLAAAIAAPVNEKFMAAGASRTHFNLKEFVVLLPALAVQRAFADTQERVNDELKRLRQAAHALEAAKRQLALAAASGSVSIEASEERK
ncbi:hypothetical protein QN355_09170 [Cryobacterium sp. 10S3]|uniref:hypothetical protein n=1 Tax=unclassified Cryobacterium TaxID=2649013 RepID=UPI002AC9E63D|nr:MULTISPECIES: hypothetical protein [unclassified Cryobacterium]MEB0001687.1 hypothetical protein [Cryobacterium sp. RTC2.1]MEB0286719.1 hypothetical protein [Cryobacterium sp. 10S3]WPX13162.1 hypothetical protein RHM57_16040 [Cryobacterium sp. 10S3]